MFTTRVAVIGTAAHRPCHPKFFALFSTIRVRFSAGLRSCIRGEETESNLFDASGAQREKQHGYCALYSILSTKPAKFGAGIRPGIPPLWTVRCSGHPVVRSAVLAIPLAAVWPQARL